MPRPSRLLAAFLAAASTVSVGTALAQLTPPRARPATAPASRPSFQPGYDAIDDRLLFLTEQLASVEASIDAVTKQLRISKNAQGVKGAQADGHRKANEMMDRNMGMPTTIRWERFYGRTAEKFFYHPTGRNTSYHTLTVLGQRKPGNTDDKPDANGGVPAHQRPPQFDYLYRANIERRAMAEAEAAKMAGRVDVLAKRRRDLEAEQAALWCKVSARAVAYRNLLSTRLYRFDVKAPDDAELSKQRLETFRVAVKFLRVANRLMTDADEQADVSVRTYTQTLKATIGKARAELDESLVKQPLLAFDVTDVDTWVGKLTAVVRRMDDLSRNVVDSDKLALEGDAADDEQRKHTFRQALQDQLLILAQGVLAGDECVTAMRKEWRLEFDPAAPLAATVEMPKVEVVVGAVPKRSNPSDRAASDSSRPSTDTRPPSDSQPPAGQQARKPARGDFQRISMSLDENGNGKVSVLPAAADDRVPVAGTAVAIAGLANANITREGKTFRIFYDFTSPAAAADFRPDNRVTKLRADPDALTVLLTTKDTFPSFGFPRAFRAPISISIDAARGKASHAVSWETPAGVSINLDAFVESNTSTVSRSVNNDWKNRKEKTAVLDNGGMANLTFSVTEFAPRTSPLNIRWFGGRNQDFRLRAIRLKGALVGE